MTTLEEAVQHFKETTLRDTVPGYVGEAWRDYLARQVAGGSVTEWQETMWADAYPILTGEAFRLARGDQNGA